MKTTTSKTIEAVVVETVRALFDANGGRRVGVRELAREVEEQMAREVDLAEIHAALNAHCAFYPSDDPRDPAAERQFSFGWQPAWSNDPRDRRLWVYP